MKLACLLALLLAFGAHISQCARILGVFPYHGKSHSFVINAILRELIERGHEANIIFKKQLCARYINPFLSATFAAGRDYGLPITREHTELHGDRRFSRIQLLARRYNVKLLKISFDKKKKQIFQLCVTLV